MRLVEIGKKISELRKEINLTQGELASGICTQSLISLIERGETDPSAEVLYQIAKKLGVDVNYFFEIGSTTRLDYVNEVEKQLRRTRIFYQYNEMMEIVEAEEKNPMFYHDPRKLQLLYWHKSIYFAEEKKEYSKAIDLLKMAIDLVPAKNRAYTELELEMMMSLGGFEYRLEHFKEMLCQYQKVETIINSTSRILSDTTIKTRLYNNLGRAHTKIGKYEKSNTLLNKGIDWCIECGDLYLMPALHYQIGYNHELMGDYDKALEYLDYSISLYKLNSEYPLQEFLSERRAHYLEKLKGYESLSR